MADKENILKGADSNSDNTTHSSDSERETSQFEATSRARELSSENQSLNVPRTPPTSSLVACQQLRQRGDFPNRTISGIEELPLRSRSLPPSTRMLTSDLVPMSSEANKLATGSVVEGAASAVTKSPLRQLGTQHDLRSTGSVCTEISEFRTRLRSRSLPLETEASERNSSNRPMSLNEAARLLRDLSVTEYPVVHSGERKEEFQRLQLEARSSSSSIPDLELLPSTISRGTFHESLEASIQTVDLEGFCQPIVEGTVDQVHSRDPACSKLLRSPLKKSSPSKIPVLRSSSGEKKKTSKHFSEPDRGDSHKSTLKEERDASNSFGLYARLQEMNIQGRSSDIAHNSDTGGTPETESSVYPYRSLSPSEVIPILPGEQSTSSDKRQMTAPPCSRESSPIRQPPCSRESSPIRRPPCSRESSSIRRPPCSRESNPIRRPPSSKIFKSSDVLQNFFGSSNAEIIPTSPEQPSDSLQLPEGTLSRISVTNLERRFPLLGNARTYLRDLISNIRNDLSKARLGPAANFGTPAIAASTQYLSLAASSEYLSSTVERLILIRYLIWDIAREVYELQPRRFRSWAMCRTLASYHVQFRDINNRHSRFLSDTISGPAMRPMNSDTISLARRVYNYLTILGVVLENLLRFMMSIVNNNNKIAFLIGKTRQTRDKKDPRNDNDDDSKGGLSLLSNK